MAVARVFGDPDQAKAFFPRHEAQNFIEVLEARPGVSRYGTDQWHADITFAANPPTGTVLYSHIVPESGGDTVWPSAVSYTHLDVYKRQSLTYLKRLSVALLKIDQSFIRGMLNDPDDLAIVQSVLGLATAFRRQVVAEGVETVEHGEMLLQFGCELAQGYGIARPMPAAELPEWATAWRSDPRWLDVAPVGRKDLARIFACVEFRAWAMAFELFLKHERDAPPLALHRSRLGAWLDAETLSGRRAQPAVPVS